MNKLLNILHYPDERLHLIAKPVKNFDNSLLDIIEKMKYTMYHNNGIGLAATQVNIQLQLFIMDINNPNEDETTLQVFINPKIISHSGSSSTEEGCLSVPGIYQHITRATNIELSYQDQYGNLHIKSYDGLMATCIQHELDHLNGKVFVEYLSSLKQDIIRKKMKKLQK